MTQEKLAEHLGVSCQAVSKWESENGYPDIEFIPALAYYFNVTTDMLLGVDTSRNREIMDGYLARYFELSHDLPEQLALIREAAAKFPNHFMLLQALMYSLVFSINIHRSPDTIGGMMTKSTAIEETTNRELLNEAVIIAERVLKECTDDRIRHSAIQVLCYYYPLIDKKDDAVMLAKSMPPLYISRDALLEEICTGDEKIRQIQRNISSMTDYLCGDIVSVADPDSQQQNNISNDEKIHLIDIANKIFRLVFENDVPSKFSGRLARNFRLMAALALLDNHTERALEYLEQAAEYAIAADTLPVDAPFISLSDSPMIDGTRPDACDDDCTAILNHLFYQNYVNNRIVLKLETIEANQSGFLLKKLEQSRYDTIRHTDRFEQITNNLKQRV